MSDMIKLRQRFCKDCDIPVNIFDEPYFSDRLKLFDFLYNSISKWDLFKSELAKYDSAMDYFIDYSRIKDEAIEAIRSTEGFQLFTAYGINDFSIKNKGLPVSKIYKPENNGRVFLSIDMKKANFSALREYRDDIFGGSDTWEEFISRFTDNKHIINSKYIRQVIMGNLNPKRQTAYEKILMDKLLTDILHAKIIGKENVATFLADEITRVPIEIVAEGILDTIDRLSMQIGIEPLVNFYNIIEEAKGEEDLCDGDCDNCECCDERDDDESEFDEVDD